MEKWRPGSDGYLECVNEKGEVIAREKRATVRTDGKPVKAKAGVRGRRHRETTHHYIQDQYGRKIWVPKGTNPDDIPRIIYPFCATTSDLILQYVTEGKTLSEIGAMEGMPPTSTIHKWQRQYPEFHEEMKKAKKARAEWFADKAVATANDTKEFNVQSNRLKIDTLKWAAEVGDRETFGKSTKITGDANAPLAILVSTGIDRDETPTLPEPTAIPVESRPVDGASE